MCLIVIRPEQSAATAREELESAMKSLAEAQLSVTRAIQTVRMFEHNFRGGSYKEREREQMPPDDLRKMGEAMIAQAEQEV